MDIARLFEGSTEGIMDDEFQRELQREFALGWRLKFGSALSQGEQHRGERRDREKRGRTASAAA